ncbi:hypothetical protein LCGC14_1336220 [marine sediment metagenome]|uniref:Uncharacterized protein n=1 Tax=marine sediment metagenome TaxID=412755 RepID=A0A0F9KFU9_9ZZZZ
MKVIKKSKGKNSYVAIIEIKEQYYVVSVNKRRNIVRSFLPSDTSAKKGGGSTYFGRLSSNGVRYVSSPRKRQNALRLFRRYIEK